MRKIDGPGNVSGEFADYDAVTNPNGTVVTADWANDVQDELLGVQDAMSVAEAAGTNEYVAASIIGLSIRYGKHIGEIFAIPGEVRAPAAFDKDDPTAFFPAVCISDIEQGTAKVLDVANYPDLVPQLRDERLVYLDEQTGETINFAGTAAASVITLTDTTANNDLLAALVEFQADFGTYTNWLTLDWDGTTYAITDVDAATRQITVTGTPTAGAGTATIYPHRIAGSTTTARVHSAVGKDLRAAGTTEYLAGLMWRDQMQGHWHRVERVSTGAELVFPNAGTGGVSYGSSSPTTYNQVDEISAAAAISDGTNGTPRVGTTTRGAGMGVHFYLHGGRYAA